MGAPDSTLRLGSFAHELLFFVFRQSSGLRGFDAVADAAEGRCQGVRTYTSKGGWGAKHSPMLRREVIQCLNRHDIIIGTTLELTRTAALFAPTVLLGRL